MADFPPWLEVIAGAIGGGGLTKLGDALFGRKAREVKALQDTVGTLSEQLQKSDARMDEFGERLDECNRQHEACERGRREDRRALEERIDELLADPRLQPASYKPSDLKRPRPRRR